MWRRNKRWAAAPTILQKRRRAPRDNDDDNDENKDMKLLLQKASPPIDWNPSTFSNITKLNLPECGLSSLPANLGTWLPNLSILFCPKNKFEELPAVIGSCPNLQVSTIIWSVGIVLCTLYLF